MTTEELCILIELRHKFKREISKEEFQTIKPLKSDPEKYDIDVVDEKIVKRYTSCIYNHICDNVEYFCERFIKNLTKKGYNVISFRYLDSCGNVVSGYSCIAHGFSVAFTNPDF